MDQSSKYVDVEISIGEIMDNSFALWEQKKLLDVTLVCEGQKIDAHRIVLSARLDYFNRMFTGGMAEASQCEVPMEGISFAMLNQVLNFVYSGKFRVTTQNACEMLQAADYLGVAQMKKHCEEFLLKEITSDNCLTLLKLADQVRAEKLYYDVTAYTAQHFSSICLSDQFMQCDCIDTLEKLLSLEHLIIEDQNQLLDFIAKWTKQDCVNRTPNFPRLLRHVRFSHLSFEAVTGCDLVMGCEEGRKKVEEIRDALEQADAPQIGGINDATLGALLAKNIDISRTPATIMCVGGYDKKSRLSSIEIFDSVRNEWRLASRRTNLRSGRCEMGVVCVGTKLFVVGGDSSDELNYMKTVECFDFITGKWSDLAPLHNARSLNALVALNKKCLYAIGGWGREPLNSVERYNISSNEWVKMAPMSIHRAGFAAAVYAGEIFVAGGYGKDNLAMDSCECYDPVLNEWTQIAPMLRKRHNFGAAVVENYFYAIGGSGLDDAPICDCERYSFEMKKWTQIESLSVPRDELGVVAVGRRIFAIGGCNDKKRLNTVEVYDTVTGVWRPSTSLNEPRRDFGVTCLHISKLIIEDL